MKNLLLAVFLAIPLAAFATDDTKEAASETAKKVDASLSEGAKKIKNLGKDKKKRKGNTTTDKVNDAWDSALGAVGGVIRSQNEPDEKSGESKEDK